MQTTRTYDKLNRLTLTWSNAYGTAATNVPTSFAYQYNAANQRTRATLGDGGFWVYQYDALGQVISGTHFWADGTLVAGQDFSYAFDDIGNRTTTGGRASAASTYTVNRLNQYSSRTVAPYVDVLGIANPTTNVTVNGTVANRKGEYFHWPLTVPNTTPQYPNLTIVSQYGATQTQTGAVYVAASTESFQPDADGNLISDGRWTYTWDGENRLVQMIRDTDTPAGARQKLIFEYDHQGRRIRKQFFTYSGGWQEQTDTVFLYDGWNLVAELNANASNGKVRSYVWGTDLSGSMQGAGGVGGLLKVTYVGASTTNAFVAYDGNGNVAALLDAADGNLCARIEYGPFAEAIRATGPLTAANAVRFSTKYTDDESGLSYYGYRYLIPGTGRWLSRDPIGEYADQVLYPACGNSPINRYDALGLRACCTCLAVKIVVSENPVLFTAGQLPAVDPRYTYIGLPIIWRFVVTGDPSQCTCRVHESGYWRDRIADQPPHDTRDDSPYPYKQTRIVSCERNGYDAPGTGFERTATWPGPTVRYWLDYHLSQTLSCESSSPYGPIIFDSRRIEKTFLGQFSL
jgi:RHS repeat-associated protein